MRTDSTLIHRHPWLAVMTTVEDYIDPDYYDRILREYVFDGRTDLEIFSDFAHALSVEDIVLELGCGTGRATGILLRDSRFARLDLVDLSPRMIRRATERFSFDARLRFVQSDAVRFFEESTDCYDAVYSLWSFSHAVHQRMITLGLAVGWESVQRAIGKFVHKNMRTGTRCFLIHFDSLSEEQRVLIQQWRKIFPVFNNVDLQSPSKRCMDEILERLAAEGTIRLSVQHLEGQPIVYASIEDALEVFMNFHLESFFNASPRAAEVIQDLRNYFALRQRPDGTLAIATGCFVYAFEKLHD